MDEIAALDADIAGFSGSESQFIAFCAQRLSRIGEVCPWSILRTVASGIGPKSGCSYQVSDKLVLLTKPEDGRGFTIALLFTGVKPSRFRSSEFIGVEHRYGNEGPPDVATSYNSMVHRVLEGEFDYTEYPLSEPVPERIDGPEIYQRLRLGTRADKVARPGEVFIRDRRDLILVPGEQAKSVVLVVTATRWSSPFQFRFHATDGRLVGVSDAEPRVTRQIKSVALLEKHGNASSLPYLRKMVGSDHHMIRWLSIRAMVNLDSANAGEHLALGLEDPNSEIRATCRTLQDRLVRA